MYAFPSPGPGLGAEAFLPPTGTEGGALILPDARPRLYAVTNAPDTLQVAGEVVTEAPHAFGVLVELAIDRATPEAEKYDIERFRDIVRVPFATNVERDPKLRDVSEHAEAKARSNLATKQEVNNQLIREDRLEELPEAVDAMGTANKLVAIGRIFGKDSPEYRQVRKGLWMDKYRRVSEAWDHNGEVVFDEELIQELDPETGHLFADGLSVDETLENGLVPTVAEEEELRINNFKGHAVVKELIKDDAAEGEAIIQIWPCPKYAIDAYNHNPNAAPQGYAPKIKKFMIVRTRLLGDNKIGWNQLGAPGDLINDEVMEIGYKLIGALEKERSVTKTEAHGIQARVPGEITEFDIMEILDLVASRVHGKDIFMGKRMEPGQVRDYQRRRQEGLRHREIKAEITDRLVDYVEAKAEQGVGSRAGTALEDAFLKKELLEIARHDPERAAIMFDEKTAAGFREVKQLETAGKYKEALLRLAQVAREAPAAGGCGAGLCGLEAVDFSTPEGRRIKEALDLQEGEEALHDTERPCPHCGKMTVYYAFTSSYVKKVCMNEDCGAKDFKAIGKPAENTKTKRIFTLFDHESKTTQKIFETRQGYWRVIKGEKDEENH